MQVLRMGTLPRGAETRCMHAFAPIVSPSPAHNRCGSQGERCKFIHDTSKRVARRPPGPSPPPPRPLATAPSSRRDPPSAESVASGEGEPALSSVLQAFHVWASHELLPELIDPFKSAAGAFFSGETCAGVGSCVNPARCSLACVKAILPIASAQEESGRGVAVHRWLPMWAVFIHTSAGWPE